MYSETHNQAEISINAAKAAQVLMSARTLCNLRHRDVAAASRRIANRLGPEFAISICRLADLESGRVIPTVWTLCSLCAVYSLEMAQVMHWYGVQPRARMAPATAA